MPSNPPQRVQASKQRTARSRRWAAAASAVAATFALSACSLMGAQASPEPVAPVPEGPAYRAPFAWADGTPVEAKVVNGVNTARQGFASLPEHRADDGAKGRAIGIRSDGGVVVEGKDRTLLVNPDGSASNYVAGDEPELWNRSMSGDQVFGSVGNDGEQRLYAFEGPGKGVGAPVAQGGDSGDEPLVKEGVVYWSEATSGTDGRSRVMSAERGGAAAVAREGAYSPMPCGDEICVVLGQRPEDVAAPSTATAVETLKGKSVLKVTGELPKTNDVHLRTDGDLVVASNVGPAGVLIMNTATKKAWMVTSPGVVRASYPLVSDGRVAWDLAPAEMDSSLGREAWTFDAATGTLRVFQLGNDGWASAGLNGGRLLVRDTNDKTAQPHRYEVARLD